MLPTLAPRLVSLDGHDPHLFIPLESGSKLLPSKRAQLSRSCHSKWDIPKLIRCDYKMKQRILINYVLVIGMIWCD